MIAYELPRCVRGYVCAHRDLLIHVLEHWVLCADWFIPYNVHLSSRVFAPFLFCVALMHRSQSVRPTLATDPANIRFRFGLLLSSAQLEWMHPRWRLNVCIDDLVNAMLSYWAWTQPSNLMAFACHWLRWHWTCRNIDITPADAARSGQCRLVCVSNTCFIPPMRIQRNGKRTALLTRRQA